MLGVARLLASQKDTYVGAVLIGSGVSSLARKAIYYGADMVYVADDERFDKYYPTLYGEALAYLAKKYKPEALLVAGTMRGREFTPYVANILRTGITADYKLHKHPTEGWTSSSAGNTTGMNAPSK
jgi:electron transfer flavoprotein alpha subunit